MNCLLQSDNFIQALPVCTQGALKQSMDLANQLTGELESLRNSYLQQERTIDGLKVDMRSRTTELLDNGIQRLQAVISEKDSAIALMEIRGTASLKNRSCIHALRQEKNKLMKELKEKVRGRIDGRGGESMHLNASYLVKFVRFHLKEKLGQSESEMGLLYF